MQKKIILIGGAPAVGKSFISKKISKNFKIPWISTDTIREIMRTVARKEDYPDLFYFTKQDPNDYLRSKTAEQIVFDQNKESADVWRGVEPLIKTDHNWGSFIIEGVAILPEFISKCHFDKKQIEPIFILDDNKQRIEKVIYERGLWTDPEKYADDLKNKEIEWVVAFNNWLDNELRKYNYPVIRYKNNDLDISEIEKLL